MQYQFSWSVCSCVLLTDALYRWFILTPGTWWRYQKHPPCLVQQAVQTAHWPCSSTPHPSVYRGTLGVTGEDLYTVTCLPIPSHTASYAENPERTHDALFLYEQGGNLMNYSCTSIFERMWINTAEGWHIDLLHCVHVHFTWGNFWSLMTVWRYIIRKPAISVFMSTQTPLIFILLFCLDFWIQTFLTYLWPKSRLIMTF